MAEKNENVLTEEMDKNKNLQKLTEEEKANANLAQLVTFKVDNEVYGLEILKIQEIVRLPVITRLPKTTSFIKGVINLRGNIVPVIDLREKFGLASKKYTKLTRAIVVEIKSKNIALIVDEVSQVLRIDINEISDAPSLVSNIAKEFIKGVARHGDKLIIILKMDKILSSDDIVELEKINENE